MRNSATVIQRRACAACWLSFALILPCVGVVGCDSEPVTEGDAAEPALESFTAEVMTVAERSWPTIVHCQGSLLADETSIVGAEVAGRVAEVHVDLGDAVEAGQPLVSLEEQDFLLEIAQAEAQLQQARSALGLGEEDSLDQLVPENAPPVREQRALWDEAQGELDRAEKLKDQNAIARAEYDTSAAAVRVAEARYASAINAVREKIATIGVRAAELGRARRRHEDAVIVAPFAGFIQQRDVSEGNYLSVGQPIGIVVRTDPLRFRGTVPERFAQSLRIGQTVKLQIESVAGGRDANVDRISPMLDLRSRALAFEAEIENADHQLTTGLFAVAQVVVDPEAKGLVVPQSAVIEFAGTQKVWKVSEGVAGEQPVLLGQRRDGQREILGGLVAGDQILLDATKGRVARVMAAVDTQPSPR